MRIYRPPAGQSDHWALAIDCGLPLNANVDGRAQTTTPARATLSAEARSDEGSVGQRIQHPAPARTAVSQFQCPRIYLAESSNASA
jgi:hypothetical protein